MSAYATTVCTHVERRCTTVRVQEDPDEHRYRDGGRAGLEHRSRPQIQDQRRDEQDDGNDVQQLDPGELRLERSGIVPDGRDRHVEQGPLRGRHAQRFLQTRR